MGFVFIESGWGKLHDIPKVVEFFQSLGIPYAEQQAPFVAATEFVCGLAVFAGFATRLAAIPLTVTMVIALMTALKDQVDGFSSLTSISEFLYIVILVNVIFQGAGCLSLDYLIKRKPIAPSLKKMQ